MHPVMLITWQISITERAKDSPSKNICIDASMAGLDTDNPHGIIYLYLIWCLELWMMIIGVLRLTNYRW